MAPKEKLQKNLEEAYQMYQKGYSYLDVGNTFGVSHSTIRRSFIRNGLITRPRKQSVTEIIQNKISNTQFKKGQIPFNKHSFILDEKQCHEALELYVEGWSFKDIGEIFDCSWGSIQNLFKKRGYYVRTKKEQQSLPHIKTIQRKNKLGKKHTEASIEKMKGKTPHNKHNISHQIIIKLYKRLGSSEKVSDHIPLSATAIRRTLHDNGIKLIDVPNYLREKNLSRPRDKHYNWQGGKTPVYKLARNHTRYVDWRFNILKKHDFKCFLSGEGGTLEVHHAETTFSEIIEQAKLKLGKKEIEKKDYYKIVHTILDINETSYAIPLKPKIHKYIHKNKISFKKLELQPELIKSLI